MLELTGSLLLIVGSPFPAYTNEIFTRENLQIHGSCDVKMHMASYDPVNRKMYIGLPRL